MSSQRIRVCHVITQLELGGAQQNTLYTVSQLNRDRFEPTLLAGSGGMLDSEAERIRDLTVEFVPNLVREVSPVSDIRAFANLVRIFRRLRPSIVHTHSSKAGILGRLAAQCAGVPVIVHTIHGYGFHAGQGPVSYGLFWAAERFTAPMTDRIISVSHADLDYGVQSGLFPPSNAVVIRSGIELASFGAHDGCNLRTELGLTADIPIIGMVACLKPQKAPLDFVQVAHRVRSRVPKAHFVLAGDGELRASVEAEVTRLGLDVQFHLLGWRRDVPALLASLNVFVLTSRWEGLPRVILEAMNARLPVVATRVNGTPEAVVDQVTGYLVDPGDVDTMVERVVYLLDHPVDARQMGENGQHVIGPFDINRMVRQQESLYLELIADEGLS